MHEPGTLKPANPHLHEWVQQQAVLCKPDRVFWCDGSAAERQVLLDRAVAEGVLIKLNQERLPGCYYHRSNANDVARVEQCTYICTHYEEDAGPTNNWMA
ncbi:MAG: phosphoenolpyruvate carboxykinase, partial [Verrucomicrobia bacterium]|nr:phosphoenolpyruvate carboxykinase [Verrucomicrobiota bacterium]